ncbi:MAG: sulfite exporter TauE/SafE family protein [Luteibaculaceae bacterium]
MWPAFLIGFTGSLHCVGMCGPIAMAAPVGKNNRIPKSFLYHSSRLLSYAALGFLFGGLGYGFSAAGLQKSIAIGGALLLLAMIWIPAVNKKINTGIGLNTGPLKIAMAKQLKTNRLSALVALGMLNGFLPCSLVYFALTGAIITGSPTNGALFMLLFGLGTLPAMFSVGIFQSKIPQQWRYNLVKVQPILLTVIALMLLLRGLDLGIPFLSPNTTLVVGATEICN